MAAGVEMSGVEAFEKTLAEAIKKMPELQRQVHERAAELLKQRVDANISGSLNDSNGRVAGWQQKHVGSMGGYAAVRPIGGGGQDGPSAVTNYLEGGHAIRRPSGSAQRARPSRAVVPYVDGRHFYQKTEAQIDEIAEMIAEELAEKLAGELEG